MKPILLALAATWPVVAIPAYAQDVTLPTGSEGIPQSANSLPPGFLTGTPQYNYTQSVGRSFMVQSRQVRKAAKAMKPALVPGRPAS